MKLPLANDPKDRLRVFHNPSGETNLQVLGESGRWVTFYSSRDIQGELNVFYQNLNIPEDHIAVVFGLGLGYHLKEVLKKTLQRIIVVEKDEEIFRQALATNALADFLANPNISFLVGKEPDEIIQEISSKRFRFGFRDIFLIKHPPSIRCFPNFYTPLLNQLENSEKIRLGQRLRYRKFRERNLHILLINSQYLMMGELVGAIQSLGHTLRTIIIEREAEIAQGEFFAQMIKILVEFKPDFVLTVNHLGFDREGIVTDFLTTLKIPFASWYVDSPMLIIRHFERNLSPYCAIFLWDQDYLADMQNLGFDKVHYLPLGTAPNIFRPIPSAENPLASEKNNLSFVGNSMVKPVKKKMERLGLTEQHKEIVEELGRVYAQSSCRNVSEILEQGPFKNDPLIQAMQNGKRVDFEALVMCQGTLFYRLDFIRQLGPFQPVIRGDDGWRTLLGDSFQIRPELLYYYNLNSFYNVSKVNFNATSTQMRNSVNQRVFDVPAAGRFLLTDYKKQLEGLFEIGKEMICYRDKGEIPDLVKFYLTHDSERERIAERGRKRVLRDHTYTQRVNELCEYMRKQFKEEK
jgi:spore maturation protein CgeB